MEVKEIMPDFMQCAKLADTRIDENGENYGMYKNHVAVYKIIKEQLREMKIFEPMIHTALDEAVKKHAMHCIALKLARISANPSYDDSYTDVIGYVRLYVTTMPCFCKKIAFSSIYGIPNQDKINEFLVFVNSYIYDHIRR